MNNTRRNWKKYFTTLALSASLAVGTMGFSIAAFGATVNTDGVNIRSEASTDSGIIGSLYAGDVVEIVETTTAEDGTTWYLVRLSNGNTGYVRSDFVDDDGTTIEVEEAESSQEQGDDVSEEQLTEETEQAEQDTETVAVLVEETVESEESSSVEDQQVETESDTTDPSKDPNTNYSLEYVTNPDGSGQWYVLNVDSGEREAIGTESQSQGQSVVGVSSGWRVAAILFGLLLIAAIAFILFLIRSINEGRNKGRRRTAVQARRSAAVKKQSEGSLADDDRFEDTEDVEENDDVGITDEEVSEQEESDSDEEYDFEEIDDFEEVDDNEDSDEFSDSEDEEYYDDLEEDTGKRRGGFLGIVRKILRSDEEEDLEEFEEDDEDFEEAQSESEENFEEYEELDDYEFGEDFDEDAEYPEDIDLLPRKTPVQKVADSVSDSDEEVPVDEEPVSEDAQARLSMDKVMRNMKAEAEEGLVSDDIDFEEIDDEDLDDAFFDDDDDMEYSFLNKKRK